MPMPSRLILRAVSACGPRVSECCRPAWLADPVAGWLAVALAGWSAVGSEFVSYRQATYSLPVPYLSARSAGDESPRALKPQDELPRCRYLCVL